MTIGRYAMIQTGNDVVINIIVSESGFTIDGFEFRALQDTTVCEPGMYFNRRDGLYYFDAQFTQRELIAPEPPASL
ncbi:hypothetical protein VB151_10025 [Xanthomonas fragariae]|uniref:Uncharacterized protein n=1 Tax=Xanthomonas fragariae TaxID=48664 RepID=A0A1Y6HGV1_9XANT|nr:hypothetical protein [Xanthomonas fragariae]AOD13551.1 hypothetical protein BER92_00850 [Xanthomonas fragariae]AOD16938.1 hypothetical protein BER93_00840 [Xanthomonas fragariae]ENZ95225.1 hypothetical protein O1K_11375 [Xanthomonas fragariae LMG 25863]MBL9198127.1 hypothetical protein [Xanthomonas fragariae]MBL9222397.1 hypothetical protein [Xanthomonas fragariae]